MNNTGFYRADRNGPQVLLPYIAGVLIWVALFAACGLLDKQDHTGAHQHRIERGYGR